MEGGASVCLPCAQGADASGCIACPPGHYTEASTTRCQPCPANTVVLDPGVVGRLACVNCGTGLISADGKTCTTDCTPTVNGTRYDLRKIGRYVLLHQWNSMFVFCFFFQTCCLFDSTFHEVRGSLLFTASGMQYFHVFNISLCGKVPVNCANNITFQSEGEPKSVGFVVRIFSCKQFINSHQFPGESVSLPDNVDSFSEFRCFRRKQSSVDTISDARRSPAWHHKPSPIWRYAGSWRVLQFKRLARLLRHSNVKIPVGRFR